MKEKTLVILAAGMGSRFGGPKQLFPVGPNNEFIMDYSIYSAIKYGFTKVVFVIREEFREEFENTIGKRIEGKIKVDYVVQSLDDLPQDVKKPEGREKPWGTAHALYCTKDYIEGNLAVITADDFYGDEGIRDLAYSIDDDTYSVVGYKIAETMSENGSVKRGVSMVENGLVKEIIESVCTIEGDKVKCVPLDETKETFYKPLDGSVSMLMYGFNPKIFDAVEARINRVFHDENADLLNCEIFLPDVITDEIKNGKIVKDVPTSSKWVGVTYREDAEGLINHINSLIEKGTYPKDLWN